MLSQMLIAVLWPHPTPLAASLRTSPLAYTEALRTIVDVRPHEVSLVPLTTLITFRSPYAGEFFRVIFLPDTFTPSFGLRLILRDSALSCPFRVSFRRCRIPFMVRTAISHLLSWTINSASAPPLTRKHWELATWGSGFPPTTGLSPASHQRLPKAHQKP